MMGFSPPVGVTRESSESAIGAHQRILADVLSVLLVTQQAPCISKDLPPVTLHEFCERDGLSSHGDHPYNTAMFFL